MASPTYPGQMFEKFTDGSRRVLVYAQMEAGILEHGFIGCEEILLGLIRFEDGIAAQVLASLGVTYDQAREAIEHLAPPTGTSGGAPPFTRGAKKVFELALRTAQYLDHNYIGTEHILIGLVQLGDNFGVEALETIGIEPSRVRDAVFERMKIAPSPDDLPRPGRWVRDDQREWPNETVRYPIRLVPGPRDPILIQGLECRIVGLLLFEEDFEIVWSVAGDHDMLWSQLGALESDDHPLAGTTPRWMTVVADDVGTVYERDSRVFTRSPSRWSGHVACRPVPPVEARVLRLIWIDRSVEVQL